MIEQFIADAYHARLHKYQRDLVFENTMLFQRFVTVNRKVLNNIYNQVKEKLPELNHHIPAHKRAIDQGILNYIMARGTSYK